MKPELFGRYTLLEKIGRGGMAEVFLAKTQKEHGLERLVAIKRINPGLAGDSDFVTMFIDEANIAAQLNHANIAAIFDLGRVGGTYYIALEHLHGRDTRAIFRHRRRKNEPLPQRLACQLIMKLCEGLDYAHNRKAPSGQPLNLVHRDVSLQNIIVSFDGEVKIIDFGIAKAVGRSTKTQAGFVKGKFAYMSPEQLRGLQVDRRSDVFSCGIGLYELLTNERCFYTESTLATIKRVRDAAYEPVRERNPEIPEQLAAIVDRALTLDVDERYQSADELHDDLAAFIRINGGFMSRNEVADWMKKEFADAYAEEAARIAACWSTDVPQPTDVGIDDEEDPDNLEVSLVVDDALVRRGEQVEAGDDDDDDDIIDIVEGTMLGWVPPENELAESVEEADVLAEEPSDPAAQAQPEPEPEPLPEVPIAAAANGGGDFAYDDAVTNIMVRVDPSILKDALADMHTRLATCAEEEREALAVVGDMQVTDIAEEGDDSPIARLRAEAASEARAKAEAKAEAKADAEAETEPAVVADIDTEDSEAIASNDSAEEAAADEPENELAARRMTTATPTTPRWAAYVAVAVIMLVVAGGAYLMLGYGDAAAASGAADFAAH
jgi:serine/threonine protein kinase